MSASSVIGPSITIKGDITADEPLTVAGRVEGTVSITTHPLTVDPGGHVNAEVHADAVIVSGHVNGSVVATTRIVVRESAVIEGTLSAPILSVAEGAQLRGKIDVAGRRNKDGLKLAS
jgi:cytoskeletal protein CcmA (bactofilin family)